MLITVDSLITTAKLILPTLKEYASKTESIWDDVACRFFESALNNPTLVAWLKSILDTPEVKATVGAERDVALMAACQAHGTPEVQAAVAALGFDWSKVTTYVPALLKVLLLIFGL